MKFDSQLPWPEIFQNEALVETLEDHAICAQALCGWAMIYGQLGDIPSNFGEIMAAVSMRLGVSGTADSLSAHAKEQGWLSN
jgi:hypothetical protein